MKINSTTLKTRDTSVTAWIDKHITASITIAAKVNNMYDLLRSALIARYRKSQRRPERLRHGRAEGGR